MVGMSSSNYAFASACLWNHLHALVRYASKSSLIHCLQGSVLGLWFQGAWGEDTGVPGKSTHKENELNRFISFKYWITLKGERS